MPILKKNYRNGSEQSSLIFLKSDLETISFTQVINPSNLDNRIKNFMFHLKVESVESLEDD